MSAVIVIAVVAGGAALLVAAPFDARPVTTAQLMAVLPRGREVPGYGAEFARPETGIGPSSDLPCGKVATALWSPGRMPAASTRVVLTPVGNGREKHRVESYSYAEDDAEAVMAELRASIPACAHYNAYYADLYLRFGTRPAEPPFDIGDEVVGYRVLAPPPGDPDLAGSGVPLGPGPLREPGTPVTFVRTGGVITRYGSAVPRAVAEDFDARIRRAPSADG
ncbi:hypothetical protein [Streptomyces sp. enrichment culture]|uniref:hypothetical protein n=1 Tax=Streptomyces sp. enrichment culture TaxID=1795815 RepID=UPI003F5475A8